MRHHPNHLAIIVGLVLAVVLIFKVDLRAALPYALLLAWPLGMTGMKHRRTQQRHGEHDHRSGAHGRYGMDHGPGSTYTPVEKHQQASGGVSIDQDAGIIHEETAPRFVQTNTP